ncbi:hypothetical protein LPB248_10555 [Flavobacterium sp. LPB0248]|uniref:hypothetical protein n=1 Tax=Flavobacterium sp. LPB0248 TaxID=2614441 RepID=UPI0015A58A36|nr:hypothetical protein [Flavobacterium sp. LPB0248]QLC66712.1 hypothetical protein LPB248_10555 [Flavobacterium sp. LPB0248]
MGFLKAIHIKIQKNTYIYIKKNLMPINDKFGIPIIHHPNFPNDIVGDIGVGNIEFGAGRNYFGKREFPNCYLTDLKNPELDHFSIHEDYEIRDCHFLDANCDFYKYDFDRTFQNIILCNPYFYGFQGLGNAKKFFDRAGDLLENDGKIHIIGSSSNKWCCKDSLEEYLENEIEEYKSNHTFILEAHEELTRQHTINVTYNFYKTELKDITVPNERLVLKKV